MTRTGLVRSLAVALILTGLILGGRVALTLGSQQSTDTAQDRAWRAFQVAARGQAPVPAGTPSPGATPGVPDLPGGVYLKLTMAKLGKDGVAINGDWTGLRFSSMVHYKDSPAPGQKGNMLVAFHRETHWMDVDQLGAGDAVQVQALDRRTYTYQVDFVKTVRPSDVSLLRPTDGTDLTLITCDPPWQDYNRMIFRAHLLSSASV